MQSRAEALRKLEAFGKLQSEPSLDTCKARSRSLGYSQLAGSKLHWGGTSRYRAERVAERTLQERRLTGCELLTLWFLTDTDPGRQLKYAPLVLNGRIVK